MPIAIPSPRRPASAILLPARNARRRGTTGPIPATSAMGSGGLPRAVARWLVVGGVAVYLGLATASHAFLGVPLPVLGVAALPFALVGAAAVRARIDGEGWLATPGPVEVLAAMVAVAIVLNDLVLRQSPALRDLALYLRAGWMAGHDLPVYLAHPMVELPQDPTRLPFLYPPFTLPLFAVLDRLPWPLVASTWITISVAASVAALRLLGLTWRWTALLLLWPPFAEGLYVGNVAVPALLLFAAGLRAGGALPLGAIFKLQSGIPALWLLRERRGRELAGGLAVIAGLVIGTLPLVGSERWREWLTGLMAFRESETLFPGLAGQSLANLLPTVAWAAVCVAVLVLALRGPAHEGLERIGIATIVASPSLYSHGFLVGLPAFLSLNRFWFWVAMGCTASVWGFGWWGAVAIAVAAWRVPAMNHRLVPNEALHPLQGRLRAWQRPHEWEGVERRPAARRVRSDA